MEAPRSRKSKRSRLRRTIEWLVLGGLAGVGLVVAAYFLRNQLVAPLALPWLAGTLEHETGLIVSVDEVGGDWIHDLRLSGVVVHARKPGGVLEMVSARDVELEFDLRRLLGGDLGGLQRVDLREVVARLDVSGSSSASSKPSTTPATFEWPKSLPSGSITGLDLALKLPGGRALAFERTGLQIEAQPDSDHVVLDAVAATLGLWSSAPPANERVRAELDYSGGVFDVRELVLAGDVALRAANSQLDLRDVARGGMGWKAALEACGGRIGVRGSMSEAGLSTQIDARDIELAEIWRLIAPLATEVPSARTDVNGELIVVDGRAFATASLKARDACTYGREFDLVEADLAFDPDELDVARVEVLQGSNSFRGRDLSIPFDRDGWLAQLRGSRGHVELDVGDATALTRVDVQNVPPHHLGIAGSLDGTGVELDSGRLVTEGGEIVVRRGRVDWGDEPSTFVDRLHFDLETTADFHDLAPLSAILAMGAWSGSANGALRVAGTLEQPLGRLDVIGKDVVAAGVALGDFHALAHVDRERLHVESFAADSPYGHVELSGDLLLGERTIEHATVKVVGARLGELVPDVFERGDVAVDGELAGPLQRPIGTFVLSAADVALRCGPTLAGFSALGSFDADVVHIDELALSNEIAHAQTSGSVRYREQPVPVHIETALFEHEGLALALVAPLDFRADPQSLELRSVAFAGSAGRLTADAVWRAGNLALHVGCDELDPMPLLAPFAPSGFELAHAHGTFDLALGDDRLDLTADVGLDGLRFAEGAPKCSLACRGTYAAGLARIDQFDLRSDDGGFATFTGSLPLDVFAEQPLSDGEVALAGKWSLPALEDLPWKNFSAEHSLRGSLSGEIELDGSWRALRGSLNASGRGFQQVSAHPSSQLAENLLAPADLELRATFGDALELEQLHLVAPGQLSLDATGRAELRGDIVALVEHTAQTLAAAPMDLQATFASDDLTFVTALAPKYLRRTGGALTGDLELHGSLDQPVARGSLRLERGELRTQTALPTLDRLTGAVTFEGARATIEELRGEIGAGSLATRGTIDLGGEDPVFALHFTGRDLLLVQQRNVRARANAELDVTGPWSKLNVTGRLDLTDGRYSERVDWLDRTGRPRVVVSSHTPWFSIPNAPFSDLKFDVAIGATQAFRIEVDLAGVASAKAALKPELTLRGTGREPELTGSVYVESARVSLTGSTLDLTSGSVTLLALEPRSPVLDLALETRVAGHDVTVQVRGRANDPEVEPSSTPPLPPEAIYQMLMSGQVPVDASLTETGIDTAQAVAVYLGQDLMTRWFGAGDSDESFFDRIEWQRGADVTRGGGSTFQASLRMSGPARGPGKIVYLRGERDLYDRINFGLRFLLRFE